MLQESGIHISASIVKSASQQIAFMSRKMTDVMVIPWKMQCRLMKNDTDYQMKLNVLGKTGSQQKHL